MYFPIFLNYCLLYLYYIRIRIYCKCSAYALLDDWYLTKALPDNLKSTKCIETMLPMLFLSLCLAIAGIFVGSFKKKEKFIYFSALALVLIFWYVFVDPYFRHIFDSWNWFVIYPSPSASTAPCVKGRYSSLCRAKTRNTTCSTPQPTWRPTATTAWISHTMATTLPTQGLTSSPCSTWTSGWTASRNH